MRCVQVGNTSAKVSRLCFGTLQMGSAVAQLPQIKAVELLVYAFERGITTFDTARSFHSRELLAHAFGSNPDVTIIDKSVARTYEEMERDVAESLVELGRDEADIFLLYDVRSREDFAAREGAWNYLKEAKEMGLVKAIGLSTHSVEVAEFAAELTEVNFVQVAFNLGGFGILDGDSTAMERAMQKLKEAGKSVCVIKPLAGGMLSRDKWGEALEFVFNHPLVDCICVGMTTHEEVEANCALANAESVSEDLKKSLSEMERKLVILDWCNGCEACIPVCPTQALYMHSGFAWVAQERCDWCGKCGPVCPEQAIFLIPKPPPGEGEEEQ
ncbi:MAG: aldo/keto reductase [Candidatus Fervidibacter sp.]|uniref:aldo/keto reductase n=1 Tax=Candidatus Fervidibacter sp. TaxID=3100871 RepID=UPI004048F477